MNGHFEKPRKRIWTCYLYGRMNLLFGTILHINSFMTERKPVYMIEHIGEKQIEVQHICGCTCMENDRFDSLYFEKELLLDNKIVFHNAGVYTMSFYSCFIVKPLKVYLSDSEHFLMT